MQEDTKSKNRFDKISKRLPREKRYRSFPAVKIGRFAVASEYQSSGIGKEILDLIKMWFTDGNKTGCRFVVVDAM